MKKIIFFNSLGRKLEEFKPLIDGYVSLYCCGPTVYSFATLGNFRTYIFEDFLRRTLEYNNYQVNHVMNITDVGHLTGDNLGDANIGLDKVEEAANKEKKTVYDLTQFYIDSFLKDSSALNILKPKVIPKATDHIQEQINMIKKLLELGYAYQIEDGIYFDISKWKEYGKLSGQKLNEKLAGARIEVKGGKKNAYDFALWKFSPKDVVRQMEWDSPWGKGFPGWHIECSAMSIKYLGEHFDIHCGGADHIAVHHENEIAQSEASTGKTFANYWMHGEFMMVDGNRMGKSQGNAYLVSDLIEKGLNPLAFRYLTMNTHYRIQLNFTWQGVQAANTALNRLFNNILALKKIVGGVKGEINLNFKEKFLNSINNDLNMAEALSVVWDTLKSNLSDEDKLATLIDFDLVLGLGLKDLEEEEIEITPEIEELLYSRKLAREKKDFKEADNIRNQLKSLGVNVVDGPDGQKLERIT